MSIVPSSIAELAKTFKEVGIFLLYVLFFCFGLKSPLLSLLQRRRSCADENGQEGYGRKGGGVRQTGLGAETPLATYGIFE